MDRQVTRTTYPEDPDALCLGQLDLYAVVVLEGRLVHLRHQYAGPCADATPDAL